MALNGRLLSLVCCGLISIACIFYIITHAVPQWGSTKFESITSNVGLWRICDSNGISTVCVATIDLCTSSLVENKSLCDKLRASQAFMIIACIFSGLSALCFLVYVFLKTESSHIILLTCKILSFVALIAGIIGVALGINCITDFPIFKLKLDASAIIGIVAVVINALSAVLCLFIK